MRDPTYVSLPDHWGVLPLDQGEEIYYELRLPKGRQIRTNTTSEGESEVGDFIDLSAAAESEGETGEEGVAAAAAADGFKPKKKRALLVMGAFASLRWLDCLADRLAAEGYEVCSYNHRGIPLGSYVDLSEIKGSGSDGSRSRSSSCSSSSSSTSSTSTSTSASTSSTSTSAKREVRRVLAHHHTCELLASDAWRLVGHVWGAEDGGPVHIYGASMGGFIAQQMAVQELRRAEAERRPSRVASLFLAVTARGMYPIPIPGIDGLARRVMPAFYKTGLIRLALPFLISRSKERMLRVSQ
jgi:pimeloyl-ACP methyl ester carboxylesterase